MTWTCGERSCEDMGRPYDDWCGMCKQQHKNDYLIQKNDFIWIPLIFMTGIIIITILITYRC